MATSILIRLAVLSAIVLAATLGWARWLASAAPPVPEARVTSNGGNYVVLAWNDLGMHCYNRDFQDLALLPPYNNLWAQVIRVGDPPQVITQGVQVTYVFTDNTYSVGKSNFWTYAPQLFGVSLPDNIGLTGRGLAGAMDAHDDHFVAEGIPLTEFRDSAPTTPYPYQLATIVVSDISSGDELARTLAVAPVSTEMHCDTCHAEGADDEAVNAGSVETNILALHDEEEGTQLMLQRPVLCADCHASNALGKPGQPGIRNLSRAMHAKHHEEGVPDTLAGCYNCHPGPNTRCLRDVMSQAYGMACVDCHGGMQHVSQNLDPWLQEPTCAQVGCHGDAYAADQPLYRHSKGHGGVYCEACHDSTHAIAPSRETNDGLKFVELQGDNGALHRCTVCHASAPPPGSLGPHGTVAVQDYEYLPVITRR